MHKYTESFQMRVGLVLTLASSLIYLLGLVSVVLGYGVNFDEAYNLQVPVNLVRSGVYGSRTASGFHWFDPYISTGPLVLGPVTLTFLIFGIGLLQARLVALGYAFLMLFTLGVLSKRLFGPLAASIAITLLAFLSQKFVILGMVLGEGGAVTSILLGLLMWSYAEEKKQPIFAIAAGLFWGISVWAKPSMIMALGFFIFVLVGYVLVIGSKELLLPGLFVLTSGVVAMIWYLLPSTRFGSPGIMLQTREASSLVAQQLNLDFYDNLHRNLPLLIKSLGGTILLTPFLRKSSNFKLTRLPTTQIALYAVPCCWILWWVLCNGEANYRHLLPGIILGILPVVMSIIQLLQIKKNESLHPMNVIFGALLFYSSLFAIQDVVKYFTSLPEAHRIKVEQAKFSEYIGQLPDDSTFFVPDWFMAWDISFLSDRSFIRYGTYLDQTQSDSYFIITPTIRRYRDPYRHAMSIVENCLDTVIYDSSGYTLYKLKGGCLP